MTDNAPLFDLAIIGGGVNGCGIARDAAGRGLKVCLFEKDDLASGTSSASTKLIHGGLRYLEYYEFRLVREALMEREVLLKLAPHIIWPLRFVLPHAAGLRPRWLIRIGLFLYDHLGGRKILPGTRDLDLRSDAAGQPLKPGFRAAFEYSDCWVMDSRLVVLNARAAADLGARIETRTEVVSAEREGDVWRITTRANGETRQTRARALVNAAGPWVGAVLGPVVRANAPAKVRMVQGSHIVVPKLFEHDRAYIFQNADNRIIFAIPYEDGFTLIGTTDRDWKDDPGAVTASEEEIAYLCSAASEYFARPVRREDVIWTYSGVRPLYDDGASKAQEATRDYVLKLDAPPGQAPLLSVFGGKITTYRRLAEEALEGLEECLECPAGHRPAGWTGSEPLPGGDFPHDGFDTLVNRIAQVHPFLETGLVRRLARCYGTKAADILHGVRSIADLGRHFGAGLYEREVRHLVDHEWARTAEDVLWRRSKLGLRLSAAQAQALNDWLGLRKSGAD